MEIEYNERTGGSLHIATDVVEKIARMAALEVDGVANVSLGNAGVKGFMNKLAPQSPVQVEMKDQVAQITVSLVVQNGTRISDVSEKVQQNIKSSVQNMTQITVSKVNIVVTGISFAEVEAEAETMPAE